jgi:hypothetical protein
MPSPASIASPSVLAPPVLVGFNTAFFRPYRQEPVFDSSRDDAMAMDTRGPRTAYSADLHGPHVDFCFSPNFGVYQQEMRENLDFLSEFCQRNNMPDTEKITKQFNLFFHHRFEESYFDTHSELVDSIGKQVLDRFCDLIRDPRIPLDTRKVAVRNLSRGVVECASGAVSNLMSADRELSISSGGIRATLWKTKEALVKQVLQEAIAESFGHIEDYDLYEIHYVNAVWNSVADSLGLSQIPDLMAPALDLAFLNACKGKVSAALTPDRIALVIAEEHLASFRVQVAQHAKELSGSCTAAMIERFFEITALIRQDLGLNENSLGLHAFVRLDDKGETYRVHPDASLVARGVLKVMHTERLLSDDGPIPIARGEWRDENGNRAVLFSYGENLVWRGPPSGDVLMSPGTSVWDVHVGTGLITLSDLLAWSKARGKDAEMPPGAAIGQAIRCSDSAELMDMPVSWVSTTALMLDLLARLEDEHLVQYLQANRSYFADQLPVDARIAIIDEVIDMGWQAASILVRAWYPDPWTLMVEVRGVEGETRLEHWMARNKARAIDDICLGRYNDRVTDALAVMQQIFCLDSLRDITSMGLLDDVEVYLAYVVKLRGRLHLSTLVPDIGFCYIPNITQSELESAVQAVREAEQAAFRKWLVVDNTWNALIKQKLPARYEKAESTLRDLEGNPLQQRIRTELEMRKQDPTNLDNQNKIRDRILRDMQYEVRERLTHDFLTGEYAAAP